MALDFLLDRCDALPAPRALAGGLPPPGSRLSLAGLPGSSAAVLVAALARRFPQRVFAVVGPTPTDAERWLADVQTLLAERAALYPQREGLGAEEPHFEIAGERVETLEALLAGRVRVLVTTARASAERTGVPAALEASRLVLSSGGGERGAGSGTRSSLLELLPTDTLVLVDQESAVAREVDRAWSDAAHHLEVARRLGEEPPVREELLLAPDAWRAHMDRFARLAPGG